MKFLFAFMIWSQGICIASNAASSSAAADEKSARSETRGVAAASDEYADSVNRKRKKARAQERRDVPGTYGEHSAAVVEATGLPVSGKREDIGRLIAEYAYYPQIPEDVSAALYSLQGATADSILKIVTNWIMAAPENINGIELSQDGAYESSLLNLVIMVYRENPVAGEILLTMLLDLKPNVRYRATLEVGPRDALADILQIDSARPGHMKFTQQIIDLLLEQGAMPQEIEKELEEMLYNQTPTTAAAYEYSAKMIDAASAYLLATQAAPILEEEMTRRLGGSGVRPLGKIGREYIKPEKKKEEASKSDSDSGDAK